MGQLGGLPVSPVWQAARDQELNAAKVRIALLEELVTELQVVYYHQDDARISELCEELGFWGNGE